jgi:hypothetical protein
MSRRDGGLCRWPPPRRQNKDFEGVCFCFICAQSGLCGTSSIWCKEVKNTF